MSSSTEITAAAVAVAPIAATIARRRVRGTSGSPNPYADTSRASRYPRDQANRDEPVTE